MVLQTRVDFKAHDAVAGIACLTHTHPVSWGGSFTVGLGRASSIAGLTGIDGCADRSIPSESCRTFARGFAVWIEKAVGTGVTGPVAVVCGDLHVTLHSSPADVTVTGAVSQGSLATSPMNTRACLVAVDTILPLCAGFTGCPIEAQPALARASAIHAVQTEAVPRAHILTSPRAGLALWAKEASTAGSCNDGSHTLWLAPDEYGSLPHEVDGIDAFPRLSKWFCLQWAGGLLGTLSTLPSHNNGVIIVTSVLLNFQNFLQTVDHSFVSGHIGVVYWSFIYIQLVIAEKEGKEVGEPQHGLSVHAVV